MNSRSLTPLLAPSLLGLSLLASACADRDSGNTGGVEPSDLNVPAFATRLEVGTDVGVHFDGALADFDGDGQLDLLVVSINGAVELLKGDANAGFLADSNAAVPVVGGPSTVLPIDLDLDGDLDAAVLAADGVMTLFLNDGNGGLTAGDTFQVGTTALCLVSDDIDGNGIADVVVSRRFAPQILVFTGTGAGSLTPAPSLLLPGSDGSPLQMALGDVVGDAALDLVVCDEELDRVLVYQASRAGGSDLFNPTPDVLSIPGAPSAVSIADLSGDGRNDMVISAFQGQRVEVITGYDQVTINSFSVPVPLSPGITAVADFTGDGVLDLAVSLLFQTGVSIFPGDGAGGLEPALIYDTKGNPLRLLPGDVNADGAMDLVAISAREDAINLMLGAPDYGLDAQRQHGVPFEGGEGLAHADLDGDGDEEIVVTTIFDTNLVVLESADQNTRYDMVEALRRDFGEPVHNVLARDMNGDGAADLVVATASGVSILRNTGFSSGVIAFDVTGPMLPIGNGLFGLDVADMNNDGLLDLVVGNYSNDQIAVVLGAIEPFVFSTTPILLPMSGAPVDVVAADFSGDGLPDVAVSRRDLAFVTLLLNTGGGNLLPVLDVPVGTNPQMLAEADFNRDGRTDLVVSNQGDDTVQLIVASSAEVFRTPTFATGNLPNAVLADDLNGDGNPDLLVADQLDNGLQLLLGNGNGEFPRIVPLTGGARTFRAVLADTDGDGDDDIVLSGPKNSWITHIQNRTADRNEL